MAKTPEQRVQELHDGVTWVVANIWEAETAKEKKDIDASVLKNVAGLAKRYDATQTKFSQNIDKKEKSKEAFAKLDTDLEKNEKQADALYKRIDELSGEASASNHVKAGDKADDMLTNWEEFLKSSLGQTKECKSCFDQLAKLNDGYDKMVADAIAKVRTQIGGAKAEMSSQNAELNSLEAQIRSAVVNFAGVAISKNKPDAAKAVKAVLKVFGGK